MPISYYSITFAVKRLDRRDAALAPPPGAGPGPRPDALDHPAGRRPGHVGPNDARGRRTS